MYKNIVFSGLLGLTVVCLLVLSNLVDIQSVLITTVLLFLVFSCYRSLVKREYEEVKHKFSRLLNDNIRILRSDELSGLESFGIEETCININNEVISLMDDCRRGKINYKTSTEQIKLFVNKLIKLREALEVLLDFKRIVKEYEKLTKKYNLGVDSDTKKIMCMYKCIRLYSEIISK